jgi:hypothetical protein
MGRKPVEDRLQPHHQFYLVLPADDSKDYMLLGCFNNGDLWDEGYVPIAGLPAGKPGRMSSKYCASLARARNLSFFATQESEG